MRNAVEKEISLIRVINDPPGETEVTEKNNLMRNPRISV
jgi:hypothetical protein